MNNLSIAKKILVLLCYFVMVGNLSGQNKVIDLWEGKIPGAKSNEKFKQMVDTAAGWVEKFSITTPCLYYYPAPEATATGTSVIICPGGSYWGLAIKHEGEQVAKWLNNMGITAFVLKYRLPDDDIMEDKSIGPMQDGQRAIRMVRNHANEWGIDPGKIGIMGFSAGGHLAATLSTLYSDKVYKTEDTTSARPDFSILIYPVISMDSTITHLGSRYNLLGGSPNAATMKHYSAEEQVNSKTPPAFMVHSMDDDAVPVQNSISYALAMKQNNVTCELHIYQSGGHGYGLGKTANTESTWPETCCIWLRERGLLTKSK